MSLNNLYCIWQPYLLNSLALNSNSVMNVSDLYLFLKECACSGASERAREAIPWKHSPADFPSPKRCSQHLEEHCFRNSAQADRQPLREQQPFPIQAPPMAALRASPLEGPGSSVPQTVLLVGSVVPDAPEGARWGQIISSPFCTQRHL